MNNFMIIYKILKTLEKAMDYPEFDISQISADKFNITEERWSRYIEMLANDGYITGVKVYTDLTGETNIENNGIRITLKGLEYLLENSMMKQCYNFAKGIKDFIPFGER